MSKTLHRNLKAKMDAMKAPEWDSSDEEEEEEEEKNVKSKTTTKAKTASKSSKQNKDKADNPSEEKETEATVLYIGHLPNEFEERDLKNFLQQFGKVLNVRISRSVKSGHSRGYAFARFEDAETTRIVAETLQGYFVGQRRLICHPVPNPKKSLFYDTDKVMERRKLRIQKAEKERKTQLNSMEKIKEITARLVQRERKTRSKLQKLGIDYDFPGYKACVDAGADEIKNKDKKRQGSEDAEGLKQNVHDEGSKSEMSATASPSSSSRKRKDSVGSEASASKKSKGKNNDDGGQAKSPLSSKKESTAPSDKKTPPSSKKDKTALPSENKKDTPSKPDRDSKTTTNKNLPPPTTRTEKPMKRKLNDVTPAKAASEKPVAQSEMKANKNKKSKKRRESAP